MSKNTLENEQNPSDHSGVAFLCAWDGFTEVVVTNEKVTMDQEVSLE